MKCWNSSGTPVRPLSPPRRFARCPSTSAPLSLSPSWPRSLRSCNGWAVLNRRAREPGEACPALIVEPRDSRPYDREALSVANEKLVSLDRQGVVAARSRACPSWDAETGRTKTVSCPCSARMTSLAPGRGCSATGSVTMPVVREEDLPQSRDCTTRAQLVQLTIPMLLPNGHHVRRWPRLRGTAVAPAGSVTLRPGEGCTVAELTWSVGAPGLTAFERCGLGAMAATIDAAEQRGQRPHTAGRILRSRFRGAPLARRRTGPGRACEAHRVRLAGSAAHQPGGPRGVLPSRGPPGLGERFLRGPPRSRTAVSSRRFSSIRHPNRRQRRRSRGSNWRRAGPSKSGLSRSPRRKLKHVADFSGKLFDRKGKPKARVELAQFIMPGGTARHGGEKSWTGAAVRAIPLFFAPIGCFFLRAQESSWVIVVPNVSDLAAFARVRPYVRIGWRDAEVRSLEDAGLRVAVAYRTQSQTRRLALTGTRGPEGRAGGLAQADCPLPLLPSLSRGLKNWTGSRRSFGICRTVTGSGKTERAVSSPCQRHEGGSRPTSCTATTGTAPCSMSRRKTARK